jgi:hypothetical protein
MEDNIKMDFREIGWGSMDWICLAQGREQVFLNMVIHTGPMIDINSL